MVGGTFVLVLLACAQQPARSAQPQQADDGSPTRAAHPLDLDVRPVLQANPGLLWTPPVSDAPIEEVTVSGPRYRQAIPTGILSLPWAVTHPTQAWRILTPIAD
jgi:hypothetical protein